MMEAAGIALLMILMLGVGLFFSEHAHKVELDALKEKHARELDALSAAGKGHIGSRVDMRL